MTGKIPNRSSRTVKAGDEIKFEDAKSCRFKVISDLATVYNVMTQVAENTEYSNENHQDFIKEVMLKWHTFSDEQKMSKFVSNVCHELNLYLARRDPKFFTDHIVNYIQNKLEQTVMDTYLLARYASDPSRIADMHRILNSRVTF